MINAASGGVGHFAVQLAKWKGAHVIGVASGRNEVFLRELGVDQFVDYTSDPLKEVGEKVNLVLDTVGGTDGDWLLDTIAPGGSLIPVTWGQYSAEKAAERSIVLHDMIMAQIGTVYLNKLSRLIEDGRLHASIHGIFPLEETAKAHDISESRRARGKIIIQVRRS